MFIDALARAGVKHGLTKKQADKIAAQAVLGSGAMVLQSPESPFDLVDKVSSPGGTTVAGLLAMEAAGFMLQWLPVSMPRSLKIRKNNRRLQFWSIPVMMTT